MYLRSAFYLIKYKFFCNEKLAFYKQKISNHVVHIHNIITQVLYIRTHSASYNICCFEYLKNFTTKICRKVMQNFRMPL